MRPDPDTSTAGSNRKHELRHRDTGMLRMMGAFFALFGTLVLIGQAWSQSPPERLVNALAGLLLLVIGLGVLALATRMARQQQRH